MGTDVGADGKHLQQIGSQISEFQRGRNEWQPWSEKAGASAENEGMEPAEKDWEMPLGELSLPNWEQPAQLGSGHHECSSPGEKPESLRF